MTAMTIYELPNFEGAAHTLAIGEHRLFDLDGFVGRVGSIKVPAGLVALVYEHADSVGGYGLSADFLEDHADLSQLNLSNRISYITVFRAERPPGHVWIRNRIVNGGFVAGHWERKRAGGQPLIDPVVVVSPPIPPHDLVQPVITSGGTPAEAASGHLHNVVIQEFVRFGERGIDLLWDRAVASQAGIIGSDFRGAENIGSAAFERASNIPGLPDNLNFWFPQKQPRDHRASPYFKRTLSGSVGETNIYNYSHPFPDRDLAIYITPAPGYEYLITDGHPREYTALMSAQWTLTAHQSGQPDCEDQGSKDAFTRVEAEIDTSTSVKERIRNILVNSPGRQICVYGPWIYDAGHCCQPEIHPAEQIWWSDPAPAGRVYFCHLLCDDSERFWWRHQMDDGTKLKPWGAPPITGTFAIAFETQINTPAKQFEIWVNDVSNAEPAPESFQRYHLVYGGNTLISVVQDSAFAVRVSFEHVGLVGADTVRGFVVLEATVGTCTQNPNPIRIGPSSFNLPPGTDVNSVPEAIEHVAFTKKAGHLALTISQGLYRIT